MIINSYMKNRIYYKNENKFILYTIDEQQELSNIKLLDKCNDRNINNEEDNVEDDIYNKLSFFKRVHFYFYYPKKFFMNLFESIKTFTCKI